MKKKQVYEVNDLTTWTKYYVESWEEGKDETDQSAIKSAIELDDVVTMGKIVVSPLR